VSLREAKVLTQSRTYINKACHSKRSEESLYTQTLSLSHSQTLKLSNLNKKLFPAVHYIFFVFPEPDSLHQKQKRMPFPSGLRKRFSVSNKVVVSFFSYSETKNSLEFSPPLQRRGIKKAISIMMLILNHVTSINYQLSTINNHPTSKTLFVK